MTAVCLFPFVHSRFLTELFSYKGIWCKESFNDLKHAGGWERTVTGYHKLFKVAASTFRLQLLSFKSDFLFPVSEAA